MQSKTSYFSKAIFIKNIKRFWPLWSSYFLLWLLKLPVSAASQMSRLEPEDCRSDIFTRTIYNSVDAEAVSMIIIYACLCDMAVFSYLYNTKSAGMMHSLPLKRENLYITSFLSGFTFLMVPNIIIMLITGLVSLSFGCFSIIPLLLWLLAITGTCVFFLSFAVFCGMFTGQILALPVFYLIWNLVVYMLNDWISQLLNIFVYGGLTSSAPVRAFSPALYFYSNTRLNYVDIAYDYGVRYADDLSPCTFIIWYALAGIVLAVISLLLYKKRHIETTGDILSVTWIHPVFRWGMAICGSLFLTLGIFDIIVPSPKSNAVWQLLPILTICGFISYMAAQMIIKKSFKVIKGSLHSWLVYFFITTVLLLCMEFNLFGIESKVPKASEVKSVNIIIGEYRETIDSPEEIAEIERIHKAAIANKKNLEADSDTCENYDDSRLTINYELEDESDLVRKYNLPYLLTSENETQQMALEFISRPEKIIVTLFGQGNTKANLKDASIGAVLSEDQKISAEKYGRTYAASGENKVLSPKDSLLMFEALEADIASGAISQHTILDPHDGDLFVNQLYFTFTHTESYVNEKGENCTNIYEHESYFVFNDGCTNLLSFLAKYGFTKEAGTLMTVEDYRAMYPDDSDF